MLAVRGEANFSDPRLEQAVREKVGRLTGPIERKELLKITHLDISGRQIQRLDGIEDLLRLSVLDMSQNRVTNLGPLEKLRQLAELSASENGLVDVSPIKHLSRLRKLDLRDNRIIDIEPLAGITSLEHLNLRGNDIRDVRPLAGLPLTYLNLHSNRRVRSIAPISELLSLETLILRHVPVGEQIVALSSMTKLQRLNLRDTKLSEVSALIQLMEEGAFRRDEDSGIEGKVDLRDNPDLDRELLYSEVNHYWIRLVNRWPYFLHDLECDGDVVDRAVLVNEIMPSNRDTLSDADGDYPDWIELINRSSEAIDLTGWGLSNDEEDPFRWTFQDQIIGPGEHLLLFASGKTSLSASGEIHVDFRLSRRGGMLVLMSADGRLMDRVEWGAIEQDISYGRILDAKNRWGYFDHPTPGAPNSAVAAKGILTPPRFSWASGFYTNEFDLALDHPDSNVVIYYTLDGSDPDPRHIDHDHPYQQTHKYDGPIRVRSREGDPDLFSTIKTTDLTYHWLPDWQPPEGEVFKATVVRAKAWRTNYLPSRVRTRTYFCDPGIHSRYASIPVISLVSDYRNLFCDETGIYVPGYQPGSIGNQNFFKPWRRIAHIEYFDVDRMNGFSGEFEIRIQGSSSQAGPQKGLHVVARRSLGNDRIHHPLFHDTDTRAAGINVFKRTVLRAWGSARTWPVRFACAHNQMLVAHTDQDIQAYRPVVVFINGEYWGLHELRDVNKNHWYTQHHHGVGYPYSDVDIIDEGGRVKRGDNHHWEALWSYIHEQSTINDEVLAQVEMMIDLDNFVEYMIHCIYLGKRDWPNQNEAKWRPRTPGGRWRWFQFDMDQGFNRWAAPEYNMLAHTIRRHELLATLLRNLSFRDRFIRTYVDWMNTWLSPEAELEHLHTMALELAPYLEEVIRRWPELRDWEKGLEEGRAVIRRRREARRNQLQSYFQLGDLLPVSIQWSPEQGEVKLNGIRVSKTASVQVDGDSLVWKGKYFAGMKVEVTAHASPGWQFVDWRSDGGSVGSNDGGSFLSRNHSLSVSVEADMGLRPVFVEKYTTASDGLD